MSEKIVPDLKACLKCKVGSCCYEGVDITREERDKIIAYNPNVPKPWFDVIPPEERDDDKHIYSTAIRNGTCVFQDENNRCMVYAVRPGHCQDFPLENEEAAPYYKRLCVLFHEQWENNNVKETFEQREGLLEEKNNIYCLTTRYIDIKYNT